MAQFQAKVPHPLANDLPYLLTARGMTTPTIWVLFQVFIGQGVFKSATMQIQRHHIDSRKGPLRQISQEEFIDDAGAGHTDPTLRLFGRMGRDHDPAGFLRRAESQVRAVVEGAADPAFGMREVLVFWQVQTSLHVRSLQDLIVFATHNIGQSCQVGEDGSRAILPIQAQQGMLFGVVVRLEVALDGRYCPTQLGPVLPVARVSKSGNPLMSMSLQDGGTRSHNFPPFASGVAGGTQGAQAPLWHRSIRCLWQGALAGRLSRAIHIENEEVVPLPVPQSTWMLLFYQRTSQQIFQKKGSQGLDRSLIKRGEKAAECRTGRQTVASKERHERVCPGLHPLVKAFQRPFAADRIAEQHGGDEQSAPALQWQQAPPGGVGSEPSK